MQRLSGFSVFFSTQGASRAFFGLGCFEENTRIAINQYGDSVLVQHLYQGIWVWSPELRKQVRVRNFVVGPEDEDMFKISTSDGKNVTVTSTHGMKIRNVDGSWRPTLAKEVVIGSLTVTTEGIREIVSIERIPGNGRIVYNFEVDGHSVFSDGVETFDLFVQGQLENQI